jgi:tetratricopeptide (TPR) repeat protein
LACYRQVIELDPEDAQAHYNLAELYYDLARLAEAEAACLKAIEFDPALSFAYLTLGNICLDEEKTHEALRYFEDFLRLERSPAAADIRSEVAAVIDGLKLEM